MFMTNYTQLEDFVSTLSSYWIDNRGLTAQPLQDWWLAQFCQRSSFNLAHPLACDP
jgi:hypothetical protein